MHKLVQWYSAGAGASFAGSICEAVKQTTTGKLLALLVVAYLRASQRRLAHDVPCNTQCQLTQVCALLELEYLPLETNFQTTWLAGLQNGFNTL